MTGDPSAALARIPRARLLAALGVGAGLNPLNTTMIAIALPAITDDFGVAAATVSTWVVTGYLVAVTAFQLPAGAVASRFGYARTFDIGRAMFMLGTAAAVFAPVLPLVVVGRFVMAAGGALMVPTAMALIRLTVPAERRPSAFGVMGSAMGTAAAIGPAVGGLVIGQFGWRAVFLVNLPLVFLSWWLQPAGLGAAQTTPGAARRFDLGFLRSPVYLAGAGVIGLQNLAMYAILYQLPFLYAASVPDGESRLGLVMIAMTGTMATTAPIGGRLAERLGVRGVVVVAGVAGAAGILWLSRMTGSLSDVAAGLFFVGLGLGLAAGPSQAAAMSAVDHRDSAMAASCLVIMRYSGGITGTALLGWALAGSGSAAQHAFALTCFATAFGASALLAFALPWRVVEPVET